MTFLQRIKKKLFLLRMKKRKHSSRQIIFIPARTKRWKIIENKKVFCLFVYFSVRLFLCLFVCLFVCKSTSFGSCMGHNCWAMQSSDAPLDSEKKKYIKWVSRAWLRTIWKRHFIFLKVIPISIRIHFKEDYLFVGILLSSLKTSNF